MRPPTGDRPSRLEPVLEHLDRHSPGGMLAVILHGSATAGGLRPDSDLDLLLVTRRSLDRVEREAMCAVLLAHSGLRAGAGPARALEVTSVVARDIEPWSYPPTCDFQYGEWLRDEIVAGDLPARHTDPDLAVALTAARGTGRPLRGPRPGSILPRVPSADLERAMRDSVPALLADFRGDERNVLLTLARMLVTLETGRIVPKDVAAARAARAVPLARDCLELAGAAYRGEARDDWTRGDPDPVVAAEALAAGVRSSRAGPDRPAGDGRGAQHSAGGGHPWRLR